MEHLPTLGDRRKPQNGDALKLPSWLWPILIAGLVGLGSARVMLASKEDQSSHDADMATSRQESIALRNDVEKATIRDSAWKADAMRILLDLQQRKAR